MCFFPWLQRLSTLLKPEKDWGPSAEEYRSDYKISSKWLQRVRFTSTNKLDVCQEAVALNSAKDINI